MTATKNKLEIHAVCEYMGRCSSEVFKHFCEFVDSELFSRKATLNLEHLAESEEALDALNEEIMDAFYKSLPDVYPDVSGLAFSLVVS